MKFEISGSMDRPHKSRLTELIASLKSSPESFSDEEASMLFLDEKYPDFVRHMIALGKMRKAFSLTFSLEDPYFGKTRHEKIARLRQLEALREEPKLKDIITKITVKGREADRHLGLNVFGISVDFVAFDEA